VCATVNEPGVQYTWMAHGREGNAFTPLSLAASEALDRISAALRARLGDERQGKKFAPESKLFLDCVHKLEAVAYHLARLSAYKATLFEKIRRAAAGAASWSTLAILDPESVFEFEALVFQARAALDTVSWFLSHACGQETSTFKKLRKVLSARAASDKRIQQCLGLLDQCPWMSSSGVLVVGGRSTRDYVTHYGSLLTTQQTCFTVNRTGPDTALLFDMEMRGDVPVMATASEIHEEVPFFVMAALSLFLDLPLPRKNAFATDLGREFVVLSETLVPAGEGAKIGVVKEMRPGGFTVGDVSVSSDILDKAVTLSKLGVG
jgi:hypothetical protein